MPELRRRTDHRLATILIFVAPALWWRERFGPAQALGAVLILPGLWGSAWRAWS